MSLRSIPFWLPTILALGPAAAAQVPTSAPVRATSEVGASAIPYFVSDSKGNGTLCVSDGVSSPRVLAAVEQRSLKLVAAPARDRFREDLARGGADGRSVRLPDSTLYHFESTGPGGAHQGNLLQVDERGDMRWLLPTNTARLQGSVHVQDGQAIVATRRQDGGDVLVIPLDRSDPVQVLTASLPALDVEEDSLRVSASGAFFVAEGRLYMANLSQADAQALPVDLDLAPGWEVLPELTLSPAGSIIAAVVQEGDDVAMRHVVVVALAGSSVVVTEEPAEYLTPGYDLPLAPYLAISPDERHVAFIHAEPYDGKTGTNTELFVREIPAALQSVHITAEPEFPLYIDNIGLLSFPDNGVVRFVGGDQIISGIFEREILGSAEVYEVDVSALPNLDYLNVTRTNGLTDPPFDVPATMTVEHAVTDSTGSQVIFWGQEEDTGHWNLSSFPIGAPEEYLGVRKRMSNLSENPKVHFFGEFALVTVDYGTRTTLAQLDITASPNGGQRVMDFPAEIEVQDVAIHPGTGHVALITHDPLERGQVFLLDPARSSLRAVTSPGQVSESVVFDRTGRLIYGVGFGHQPFALHSFGPSPRVIDVLGPGLTATPLAR